MPKKTRKAKERAARRRGYAEYQAPVAEDLETYTRAPAQETMTTERPERPTVRTGGAVGRSTPGPIAARSFNPIVFDYSYVYSDLKRIALLAAFFFLALIVLSFVIR